MNLKPDYIIVGQGIAGTCLAHAIYKKGCSFVVIDDHHDSSSSKIAAGLFNPVVFKRLVKSWRADELLPAAKSVYAEIEGLVGERLYFRKDILRIFSTIREQNEWAVKSATADMKKYLQKDLAENPGSFVNLPFSGAVVREAGNINLSLLLRSYRAWLREKGLLIEGKINYTGGLQVGEQSIEINLTGQTIVGEKVIFCDGHKATENPYFNWLPFVLAKGELLTVRMKNEAISQILNKGIFILPLGDGSYRVGATYEWNELTNETTEKGRSELVEKLQQVVNTEFEVVDHHAGIRPATSDRRPFIGLHPEHKNIGIFNGMGAKGVMLAPYFSVMFARFLAGDEDLDDTVDIKRYYSLYKNHLN